MSGWIKIHRSILNHWLYTEKRKFSKFEAWQDMLLNVNYSDNKIIIKGNLYEVKRGQSILSLDSWSKRWNWDKSSVRRFFNLLEKDEMIIVKSDNITTHLTICKYEDYQQNENAKETQKKHRRNTEEIQMTPIEERKENKEIKETISFDWFWNLYDKKNDKKKCELKFNKLSFEQKEKIKLVLPSYIESKNDIKYRKNPLTWLNGECWEDEMENKVIEINKPIINNYKSYFE